MPEHLDEFVAEQQAVEQLRGARRRIDEQLSKVIVGQADVIEQLLISLFAGGHCLITGARRDSPRRCWSGRSRRCFI